MKLDPDDIEMIAKRVARELRDELTAEPNASGSDTDEFLDAAAVARRLGVERNWVYAHKRELGAVRLGGPNGRLRFDPAALPAPPEDPSPAEPRSPVGGGRRRRRAARGSRGSARKPVPLSRYDVESNQANRAAGRGRLQRPPRPDTGR